MKPINLDRDPVWKIYDGLHEEAEWFVRNYPKQSRRFRASEIEGCRRKIWYRVSGYIPLPKKPWLEMVAAAGDLGHDYFRYLANHYEMGLEGIKFNEETGEQEEAGNRTKVYEFQGVKFTLSCRLDGQINLPPRAVMEVKTMTTFQFAKLETAWKDGGNEKLINTLQMEKPSYLWQGNLSAMVVDLDCVYLVCVDRNLNRIGFSTDGFGKPHTWAPHAGKRAAGAVWEVEAHDRENILYKAAAIAQAVDDGVPPPPDFTASSKECLECDFFVYCHGRKLKQQYPIPGVLGAQLSKGN